MTSGFKKATAALSITLFAFAANVSASDPKPRRSGGSPATVTTRTTRTSNITEANGVATDVSAARRNRTRTSSITEANGVATDVSAARRMSR